MSQITNTKPALRRLLRIWSTLLSGSALAQLLNLLAFAIVARALTLEMIGGIAMIQGIARLIDGLVNIRSGVALTTYCARFKDSNDKDGFVGLLKAGFVLDCMTAAMAAAIAAGVLWMLADVVGVSETLVEYAPYYALVVLVSVPGLHLAVLRTFDRYGAIAVSDVAGAVLRVLLFGLGFVLDAGALWFLVVWLATDILVQLIPLTLAFAELRIRGYPSVFKARARATIAGLPGFWKMIWTTNFTTSIRALSEQGDVVLLGWLAGPSAAGVFRIAKAAAAPVLQLGFPVQQAAFPELARLQAEGQHDRFDREGMMYSAIGGGIGLVCVFIAWIAGPLIIMIMAGAGNDAAIPVMTAAVIAHAIYLTGIALLPMASALERMDGFLIATIVSALAFGAAALFAIGHWGAIGAAIAMIAHNSVWLIIAAYAVITARPKQASVRTTRS